MASKNLTFNFFGKDKTASTTMNNLGTNAIAAGKKVALAAAAMAAALAVVVVRFGVDSVKAAAEAETSQLRLTDAWAKFPATADLALEALREFNDELAKKTRFDDDAIASGQAVLAQFNLTGKQIQKLTPLLLDYAAKTGKDLPDAATDLGKALLGQGRALKALGIEFVDTGTTAGNFDQLMAALSSKVGGFAEKEGTTAAGKLEILKNRFGEVQEAIGFALMPALDDLLTITNDHVIPALEDFSVWFREDGLPAIRDFVGWVVQYKDILGPAAVAIGVLTVAQWGLNAAMLANPIGLVVAAAIVGIAALVAAFVVMRTNAGGVGSAIFSTFLNIGTAIAGAVEGFHNTIIGLLNAVLGPINTIRNALGLGSVSIPRSNLGGQFSNWAANMLKGYNWATGNTNTAGFVPRTSTINPRWGGHAAEGGLVPARSGGWMMNVGEGGQDEAIIPLDRLGGMGGKSGEVHFHFPPGTIIGSQRDAMQWLERAYKTARGQGAIPGTAFSG